MKYELKLELKTNNKKLIELLLDNVTSEEFNQEEDNFNIIGNEAVYKIIKEELTQPINKEESC